MIDLEDVQSVILRPSHAKEVELRFVTFPTRQVLKDFLSRAADVVTTSAGAHQMAPPADMAGPPRGALNVGITGAGLLLAGVEQRAYDALSPAFTGGMRAAAERLQDVGESCPEHWQSPFNEGSPVHVVILRFGDRHLGGLYEPDSGTTCWQGARLDENREPFGFRDDISDPVIEGSGKKLKAGNGVWDPRTREWRPVRTGEALLGYFDESGALAGHPDAAHIERNGSYLVIRKLEQDVGEFDKAACKWASDLGIGTEDIKAQMVGRRKDGSVLGDPPGTERNDFLYRDDSRGRVEVAPSAHIRRSNPRDDLDSADVIVRRHILFRRGYPYEEGEKKGLLFMACCADLRRQFEFVQSHWLQDGSRFGLGRERDPLIGQGQPLPGQCQPQTEREVSIGHAGRRVQTSMATFVTTKGGEYFLLPSRSALRLMGRPSPSAAHRLGSA